jgi:hypothetical protein
VRVIEDCRPQLSSLQTTGVSEPSGQPVQRDSDVSKLDPQREITCEPATVAV